MTLPKTYKAAQISAKSAPFEIVERELKQPQEGQILVKVLASGVCHSDSVVVDQSMPIPLPKVPGHEIVGDVVSVGPGEKRWKVGDRVGSGWHGGHCFVCKSCLAGDFITASDGHLIIQYLLTYPDRRTQCENENINGVITDGGHAEYVILRTESVASIPTDIEPAKAAPLLTTFNSLRHMDIHPGDVVAVQGVGGLGHLAIQFARQMGYKTVALSQTDSKRQLAMDLGAHVYVDGSKEDHGEALQKLGGAKVIMAVAPSGEAIAKLIGGLAIGKPTPVLQPSQLSLTFLFPRATGGQLLILAIADQLTVPMVCVLALLPPTPWANSDLCFLRTDALFPPFAPLYRPLVQKRLQIRGWPSGSAYDSEECIQFAQVSGVECQVQTYPLEKIQEAYDSMMNGSARFRAVITF
ncbi:SPOSA6832_03429, partial [Sporobolomyces salmonicolor]